MRLGAVAMSDVQGTPFRWKTKRLRQWCWHQEGLQGVNKSLFIFLENSCGKISGTKSGIEAPKTITSIMNSRLHTAP